MQCVRACACYLHDLAWGNGEGWEIAAAVDGNTFPEDGVQTLHLLPRQDAKAPTLLLCVLARCHGEVYPGIKKQQQQYRATSLYR